MMEKVDKKEKGNKAGKAVRVRRQNSGAKKTSETREKNSKILDGDRAAK